MADADPVTDLRTTGAAAGAIDVQVAKPRRRWGRLALMFSVPLLIVLVGAYLWITSGRTVSTDNAYVSQDKVAVSADVAG
ncbi:MAG: HlyD family secretion protein, partial [Sphingomonas sp.]